MCHPKVSEYKDLQIRKQTFRLRITDSHTLNIRMTHPNEQQDIYFYLFSHLFSVLTLSLFLRMCHPKASECEDFQIRDLNIAIPNHRFSDAQRPDDTSERTKTNNESPIFYLNLRNTLKMLHVRCYHNHLIENSRCAY